MTTIIYYYYHHLISAGRRAPYLYYDQIDESTHQSPQEGTIMDNKAMGKY